MVRNSSAGWARSIGISNIAVDGRGGSTGPRPFVWGDADAGTSRRMVGASQMKRANSLYRAAMCRNRAMISAPAWRISGLKRQQSSVWPQRSISAAMSGFNTSHPHFSEKYP